jgi:UDP-N-acetyl-D-glucosamine dehydrogenase
MKSLGEIAVIGQGYVGLPLAMAAVKAGWKVTGIDVSQKRVSKIRNGFSPIEDVNNSELFSAITSGNYEITSDFSKVSTAKTVIICVPTPLDINREPDLSHIEDVIEKIALLISNETLVINESTSYPGTLRNIIMNRITNSGSKVGFNLFFACAPERINPGDKLWNLENTPRLIGAVNKDSLDRAVEFYKTICNDLILVDSPEIAESAKLLENSFRLINIALVNELTQVFSPVGIDINKVIDAASTKPFGYMPFRPGVGVGGHCIPVDPVYLLWWARKASKPAQFIEAAIMINKLMPNYIAERALELCKVKVNPKILIVGVSYKSGLSDTRESPTEDLKKYLLEKGAIVSWHDQFVSEWQGTNSVGLDWGCDLLVLATIQTENTLRELMKLKIPILDCTGTLPKKDFIFSI